MENRGTEVAVVEAKPPALKLSPQAIAIIAENIALAEQLVANVLKRDVDYGRTPGTPTDGLWDPGAAKIMAAFNTFPTHEVIYHEESEELISWTIQTKITSHQTQQVVSTGLGAASTREPKYKYRWVGDPQNYGYTDAEIKELKTKKRNGDMVFRIENPEYGELVNTLLQMAAKRSEVDAAKSLPGVSSALRQLFGMKGLKTEPDYARFWTIVKGMGLNENAAHKALRVKSMKEWVGAGRSLDDAIIYIGRSLTNLVKKMATGSEEKPPAPAPEPEVPMPSTLPDEIQEDNVAKISDLVALAKQFWNLNEEQVFTMVGYKDRKNYEEAGIESLYACFVKIREKMKTSPFPEETAEIEPDDIPF